MSQEICFAVACSRLPDLIELVDTGYATMKSEHLKLIEAMERDLTKTQFNERVSYFWKLHENYRKGHFAELKKAVK